MVRSGRNWNIPRTKPTCVGEAFDTGQGRKKLSKIVTFFFLPEHWEGWTYGVSFNEKEEIVDRADLEKGIGGWF